MRILAVDDDELIRDLLAEIFRATHFNDVVIVDGTDSAVEAIRNSYKPFDCFLLDIQMPEMDGCEATRRIRESEVGAERIPIIAMTANIMPDDWEQYKAAGMDAMITKPINR